MGRTVWNDAMNATAMLLVMASLALTTVFALRPLQTACLAKQIAPTAFDEFQRGLRSVLLMNRSRSESEFHSNANDICEQVGLR